MSEKKEKVVQGKVDVIDAMLGKYGDLQLDIAQEEMDELGIAICKFRRGKQDIANITEEIADVHIALEYVRRFFNIDEVDVARIIEAKIKRTYETYLKVDKK